MRGDLTFGLVHGAWHRGSCWEPLVAELAGRGFPSVAVDLPADQADAGVDEYADRVVGALRPVGGPVVLVGHSMGGLTVPVVAARRPVALLVFLCALIPDPGRSVAEQQADGLPDMMTPAWRERYLPRHTVLPDGRTQWPAKPVAEIFYQDCPPADAARAAGQLRPQGMAPLRERTPLAAWPGVPVEYILGQEDRVISPEWSRHTARQRLGVTARELPGGHSPFLARPAALADELLAAAAAHGLLAPQPGP
jgi:pimeloyl-ACP methyl ester carboxylesterase